MTLTEFASDPQVKFKMNMVKIELAKMIDENYLGVISQYSPMYSRYTTKDIYKYSFVAGGAIGSLLRQEPVNDLDIFFTDKPFLISIEGIAQDKIFQDHMVENTDGSYLETKVAGKLITANAVTLKNKVQLITRVYGTPKEITDTFDYVHCTPWYDIGTDKLHITPQAYECIMNKKLVVKNKEAAHKTVLSARYNKLLDQGFTDYE